ncbi:MAG: helix-turn-helix domain-containing protein, partial [Ruthenibacterium sp.]
MTNEQKEQISELRQQGYGYSKVATLLSISKNTVKSYCRRNELQGASHRVDRLCKQCGALITINRNSKP